MRRLGPTVSYREPRLAAMILKDRWRVATHANSEGTWSEGCEDTWSDEKKALLTGLVPWQYRGETTWTAQCLVSELAWKNVHVEIEAGHATISAALPPKDTWTRDLVRQHRLSGFPMTILSLVPEVRIGGVTVFDAWIYGWYHAHHEKLYGLCRAFVVDRPDIHDPIEACIMSEPSYWRNVRSTLRKAKNTATMLEGWRRDWDDAIESRRKVAEARKAARGVQRGPKPIWNIDDDERDEILRAFG